MSSEQLTPSLGRLWRRVSDPNESIDRIDLEPD